MIDMLATLGTWNWLIGGIVLMSVEAVVPGVFMMWLGLAAIIVGFASFLVVMPWQIQLLAFAVLSIAMVPLWRRFAHQSSRREDNPFLNRRTKDMVGRIVTLDTAIVDGIGTVKLGDTIWRVEGPELPAGSRVTIEAADGARLRVGLAP